jgi:hypothetical protein
MSQISSASSKPKLVLSRPFPSYFFFMIAQDSVTDHVSQITINVDSKSAVILEKE